MIPQHKNPQQLLQEMTSPQLQRREFIRALGIAVGSSAIAAYRANQTIDRGIHQVVQHINRPPMEVQATAAAVAADILAQDKPMTRRQFLKLSAAIGSATGLTQATVRNADEAYRAAESVFKFLIDFLSR